MELMDRTFTRYSAFYIFCDIFLLAVCAVWYGKHRAGCVKGRPVGYAAFNLLTSVGDSVLARGCTSPRRGEWIDVECGCLAWLGNRCSAHAGGRFRKKKIVFSRMEDRNVHRKMWQGDGWRMVCWDFFGGWNGGPRDDLNVCTVGSSSRFDGILYRFVVRLWMEETLWGDVSDVCHPWLS